MVNEERVSRLLYYSPSPNPPGETGRYTGTDMTFPSNCNRLLGNPNVCLQYLPKSCFQPLLSLTDRDPTTNGTTSTSKSRSGRTIFFIFLFTTQPSDLLSQKDFFFITSFTTSHISTVSSSETTPVWASSVSDVKCSARTRDE